MILLCEHPAVAGAVGKWKTVFIVFHFCTAHAGCESAQSIQRSSLRRPGPPAGCSRCERSLDTVSRCVASSRVVPLTCAPPPPSPHLSASDDNDANTVCEVRDHNALRSAPLPPATNAAAGCLALRWRPASAVRPNFPRAVSAPDNSLPACRVRTDLRRPWSARKPAPCSDRLPAGSSAASPADARPPLAALLGPASRFAGSTSPAVRVSPRAGKPPMVSTAARATTSVPPDSTAWLCAAFPYSEQGVAVRFSPGSESPPVCAGATLTAADRVAPGRASPGAESGHPPPASKCGPHLVCRLLLEKKK